MAVCKNNLAMVAEAQGDYDTAKELFNDGLRYRWERMQFDDLAHSYLHLANLALSTDKFSEVSIYCDSSEKMVEKLFNTSIEQFGASEENKNRYLGMSNQFQAELHFKLGNKDQMNYFFKRAKDFYKELPIELTDLLGLSATRYHELNDLDASILAANQGLVIAESQGLTRQKEQLLQTKKIVLGKAGNEEEVLKTNEQLLLINQEKVSSQNRTILINMELREQLRSSKEAIKESQEQRRQFIILSFVGLIIFVLIASTIRNQYITAEQQKIIAEQSKLVAELELKSTEKEPVSYTHLTLPTSDLV